MQQLDRKVDDVSLSKRSEALCRKHCCNHSHCLSAIRQHFCFCSCKVFANNLPTNPLICSRKIWNEDHNAGGDIESAGSSIWDALCYNGKEAAMYHLQVIFLAAKNICAYRSHVEWRWACHRKGFCCPLKTLLLEQFGGCSMYLTSRSVYNFQQWGYFLENGIFSKPLRLDT